MLLCMALRANYLERSLWEEHSFILTVWSQQAAWLQGSRGIFSAEGKAISLLLLRILLETFKMKPTGEENCLTRW